MRFGSKLVNRWIVTADDKQTKCVATKDDLVFNIATGDYVIGEERFSIDDLLRPYEAIVQKETFEIWSDFCDRNLLGKDFASSCSLVFPKEVSYIYECNNWSRFPEYNKVLRLVGVFVLAREADVEDVIWQNRGRDICLQVNSVGDAVSALNTRSIHQIFANFLVIPWNLITAVIKGFIALCKLLSWAIIEKITGKKIDCLQGDIFIGYSSGLNSNQDPYWGDLQTKFRIGSHQFWEIPRKTISFRLKHFISKNYDVLDVSRFCCIFDVIKIPIDFIRYSFHSSIRLCQLSIAQQSVMDELILQITKKRLITMLVGTGVIEVLFFISCFKGFSEKLDASVRVFFLWEGQPWEKILCYVCRERNIETTGVQHTSIPKWCARSYSALASDLKSVKPDRYAVNAEHTLGYILRHSKSEVAVVPVESLRYSNYLGIKKRRGLIVDRSDICVISVLGDYDKDISSELIDCVKVLRRNYPRSQVFWRSHPAAVLEGELADVVSEFVDESEVGLNRVLEQSDVVVCSESSSVSVDLCLVGCPVILVKSSVRNMITLDIDDLKVIDLKNLINGIDIFSPENQNWEIGEKLGFFLNPNLAAWATILGYEEEVSGKYEF